MSREFLKSLGIISIDCEKRASSQPRHIDKLEESEATKQYALNNLPEISPISRGQRGLSLMMTQSINPGIGNNYQEEVIVREVEKVEDEATRLRKKLKKQLSTKLSNMLKEVKQSKLGKGSSFRVTNYGESNREGDMSKRSIVSKASLNSDVKMFVTEDSEVKTLAKNITVNKTLSNLQTEQVQLQTYQINQDSQVNILNNLQPIDIQTQDFQGILLSLSKRTPTIGTRQNTRLAQPKDYKSKKTKQHDNLGKQVEILSFNPDNRITLSKTGQVFNKRQISVQKPRQLSPIKNALNYRTVRSKHNSQRQSPVGSLAFQNRHSVIDNTNGQWSENLQFNFNRQKPTLQRIRMDGDKNQSFGVIDFQEEIQSCWESTYFSKHDIRQKRNKSSLGGYTNKKIFPFKIESNVIEEQIKFKAPFTKTINLYQYEEDLSHWDQMTYNKSQLTDNSFQLQEVQEYRQNDQHNNAKTPRLELNVGTHHIVTEQSDEESPFRQRYQNTPLKIQITKTQQKPIVFSPSPKQPYTQAISQSPLKSPVRFDDSPTSGDYTVDSMGDKKFRVKEKTEQSQEIEKYVQMIKKVNQRIKLREQIQTEYLKAIKKVQKKDVGFDLEYLDDKINKSLMSNAPKFIYNKYQTTIIKDCLLDKKVQSKINMGSKTKGNKKRKKINFMARNTQMYSSSKLIGNEFGIKKAITTAQNSSVLENEID